MDAMFVLSFLQKGYFVERDSVQTLLLKDRALNLKSPSEHLDW